MDAEASHIASRGWLRRRVLALAPVGAGAILLPPAISRTAPTNDRAPPGFLLSSQLLTGEVDLDPVLAERYWAAFAGVAPGLLTGLHGISGLVWRGADAEALMAAARARGFDAAASALTKAWFTGTVGSGPEARTVAYADALMYRTVADGLAPPTYVLGGPAWWAAEPPGAGVSPPRQPGAVR
jgi:fructose 5-dehydrogenase small subunit